MHTVMSKMYVNANALTLPYKVIKCLNVFNFLQKKKISTANHTEV